MKLPEYAQIMLGIVEKWVPLVYEAFLEHRIHGVKLSRSALNIS